MKSNKWKILILLIAIIFVCFSAYSAYALYDISQTTTKSVSIRTNTGCYLIGSFNTWQTNDIDYKMTYSAGTFTKNSVDLADGDAVQVYVNDTYANTVADGVTADYTIADVGGHNDSIVITHGGLYDFSYSNSTNEISFAATHYYYTVSGLPMWLENSNAKLLVWAWEGDQSGSWYDADYTDDSTSVTLTTLLPANLTGMIIVRFAEGTTTSTADWANKWNQTNTLSIGNGVVSTTPTFQYTVSGLPSWLGNDSATLLIWAWGGAGDDSWYESTYTNDGSVTVTTYLPGDITNFKIVRFAAGTTPATANWDNKFNESSTGTISDGTITSAPSF